MRYLGGCLLSVLIVNLCVFYRICGQDVEEYGLLRWRKVQQLAKDTVVQLFVHTAAFNWLEPYKSPKQGRAYGSGFFISSDGYIVSNYHVIESAAGVRIQIPSLGKEQLDVNIIGVCPERDLALLKLTDEALREVKKNCGRVPYLTLGDSDEIVRTQELLALGYPLGQEKLKSTQGIVSGRENLWGESYIQITAPLNPGNSGGPSLNVSGKVIGINTARIPAAQNIGYIIPINDVKSVIDDLHKVKLLYKPMLGCEFNLGTKDMVRYLKNPNTGGLYVSRIFKNSLLDVVGLQEGDMVYRINNYDFDLYGETNVPWSEDKVSILTVLNRFNVGEQLQVIAYRKGIKKEVSFRFDLVRPLPIRTCYPEFEKIDYEIIGGMVIMQLAVNHLDRFEEGNSLLTKYTRREAQDEPRLVVTHIFPTSCAQKTRALAPGDIISQINGEQVLTLDTLRNNINRSQEYLTIKTEDKKFVVLNLKNVIRDEDRLAHMYFYKKSSLVQDLQKKMSFQENDKPSELTQDQSSDRD
jgi:serine protease Do